MFRQSSIFAVLAVFCNIVSAGHSIGIVNKCGFGTPTMFGPFVSEPFDISGGYTSSGDITGFIIYLQNGNQCGTNGDNCLILEGTLNNGFSSVDISRIPDHAFNSPIGFSYTDGAGGRECNTATCTCNFDAFCVPTDNGAQVGDPNPNASITVTFC